MTESKTFRPRHWTYQRAKELWENKNARKHKVLGKNIADVTYVQPNPDGSDSFVVGHADGRWGNVQRQRPDGTLYDNYEKLPRDKWRFKPVAILLPDRTIVHTIDTPSLNEQVFGFRLHKPKKHSMTGYLFSVMEEDPGFKDLPVEQRRSWNQFIWVTKATGEMPVTLYNDDGRFVPAKPARFRHVNVDTNRELKQQVRTVRNLLRARAKLGVFDDVPKQVLSDAADHAGISLGRSYSANAFDKAMKLVNEDDFKSLYPLLYVCFTNYEALCIRNLPNNASTFQRYMYCFERMLDKSREALRQKAGAVVFVAPPASKLAEA